MIVGVPTVPVIIGIVIVLAAFSLRAGYRGARILLTVLGAPWLISPVTVPMTMIANPAYAAYLLIPLGFAAMVIAAVVLMWRPEVTACFDATRTRC